MKAKGRPYKIADLPPERSSILIRQKFYNVMSQTTWMQREALRRSLNLSNGAVHWGWYKQKRFPDLLTALRVIEWYENGCPIRLQKHEISLLDL